MKYVFGKSSTVVCGLEIRKFWTVISWSAKILLISGFQSMLYILLKNNFSSLCILKVWAFCERVMFELCF